MKAKKIRAALSTAGRLFLLAALLWGFYATQAVISQLNFETGYEYGALNCQKTTYETGVFLPNGAMKVLSIEALVYTGHTS